MRFSRAERLALAIVAATGLLGLNGVFLSGVMQPGALAATLRNPVALAFVGDLLVMVGLAAWMLRRYRLTRLHWAWVVVLSFVGGLAFSVPVALLCPRRDVETA